MYRFTKLGLRKRILRSLDRDTINSLSGKHAAWQWRREALEELILDEWPHVAIENNVYKLFFRAEKFFDRRKILTLIPLRRIQVLSNRQFGRPRRELIEIVADRWPQKAILEMLSTTLAEARD